MRLHAGLVGPHLAGANLGARAYDTRTRRQVELMCHPAGMHELDEDLAALAMDSAGNGAPAFDLRLVEETRNPCVAQAIGRR